MLRMEYFSNTKFADWLRGTPKPQSATAKDWYLWKKKAKALHPWRFWLAETFLTRVQDFLYWPLDQWRHITNYIKNRWIFKSHALTAHPKYIKRGGWCDLGNRMLPALFSELVNFVEVDQAWSFCVWNEEAMKKYSAPRRLSIFHEWRSPEAGMAYLDWASTLKCEDGVKLTEQALSAIEIKELYLWWTQERPKRPDPYEASGYAALYNSNARSEDTKYDILESFGRELPPEVEKQIEDSLDRLRDLEDREEKEDEEMMIRLIKVRHYLWT